MISVLYSAPLKIPINHISLKPINIQLEYLTLKYQREEGALILKPNFKLFEFCAPKKPCIPDFSNLMAISILARWNCILSNCAPYVVGKYYKTNNDFCRFFMRSIDPLSVVCLSSRPNVRRQRIQLADTVQLVQRKLQGNGPVGLSPGISIGTHLAKKQNKTELFNFVINLGFRCNFQFLKLIFSGLSVYSLGFYQNFTSIL